MRQECSVLQFEVGDGSVLEHMPELPVEEPFTPERIEFLNDVSRTLLASREAKAYPDVVTFAFWIRKASMEKMKKRFLHGEGMHLGRGVVFHIAPSNVAVNYAYSFAAGFILGNANIVRLPSKEFPQIKAINQAILTVLQQKSGFRDSIAFVRYTRSREINDYLSSICNVRVIWGGNATIQELRKSPLQPRAGEVTFADRYSICIIDAGAYLDRHNVDKVAADFYNDTYLTDQNACTSPSLVCWMGSDDVVAQARERFWMGLKKIVSSKYEFQPVQYIDKLTMSYLAAAEVDGLHILPVQDQQITRIELDQLTQKIQDYRGNSGLFYEYHLQDILELRPLCNEKLQTVSILGDQSVIQPLLKSGIKGIDRVVQIGHTMDFDFLWDGYDLAERLTRRVSGLS